MQDKVKMKSFIIQSWAKDKGGEEERGSAMSMDTVPEASVFYFFLSQFLFFLYFFIKVYLIYNVSSIYVVQQRDPITHSSLYCTIGLYCPSIPNVTVYITKLPTARPCHSHPSPPWKPQSALLGHDLLLFCRQDHLCHILDSTSK